jgi:hypothetical protein
MVLRPSIAVRHFVTLDELKCHAGFCEYAIRGDDDLAAPSKKSLGTAKGQGVGKVCWGAKPTCLGLIFCPSDGQLSRIGMVEFRGRSRGLDCRRKRAGAGLSLRMLRKYHKGDCRENVFQFSLPSLPLALKKHIGVGSRAKRSKA